MKHRYQIKKDVTYQEIDGEIKILDENQDAILSLNEAASLLWNNLDNAKTVEDMSQILLAEYDLTSDQAKSDIDSFIKLLTDHQLLSSTQESHK